MPITSLTVENFKAFGDRIEIPIAPITLIYGPNSAGKSSLIQSLMLLKQSVEGHGDRFSGLIPRGQYVDLGTFRSLTYGHDRRRTVKFEIGYTGQIQRRVSSGVRAAFRRMSLPSEASRAISLEFRPAKSASGRVDGSSLSKVRYKSTGSAELDITLEKRRPLKRADGIDVSFLPTYRFADQDSIRSFVRSVLMSLNRNATLSRRRAAHLRQLEFQINTLEEERERTQKGLSDTNLRSVVRDELRRRVSDVGESIDRLQSQRNRLVHISGSFGQSPSEIEEEVERVTPTLKGSSLLANGLLPTRMQYPARYALEEQFRFPTQNKFEMFASEFYSLLDSLTYMGPLRSYPARHYLLSGSERFDVGLQGEFTSEILYHAESETLQKVNDWFTKFDIPYEVSVNALGDRVTGELIALTLKDKSTGLSVGPSDVGFGIGQLLPIIVQGVVSSETGGAILCVEQPEIHLHPRLQAHISDLLIETIKVETSNSGESSAESVRNNQWIVETHSEALMLRLQRRVREQILSPEDVCVLYVAPIEGGGSTVTQLRLDVNGDFIDEWPDGFFEEGFEEIMTVFDR